MEERLKTPTGSDLSSPTLQTEQYSPSTGLSMKRSLQRFLQKRKNRIQATSPYWKVYCIGEKKTDIVEFLQIFLCRKQIPWGELVCARKKKNLILAWSPQWRPPKLQNGYQTWLKTLDLYLFIPLVPKVNILVPPPSRFHGACKLFI